MEQQRGLLLLFLGVQLLLMGAFLYQNRHRHSFTSFLRVLIQDRPTVGEELPFLVSVSAAQTSSQDVYTNLSQIHPVGVSEEDLPSCPLISPYISKLVRISCPPNPASGFGELERLLWGGRGGSISSRPGTDDPRVTACVLVICGCIITNHPRTLSLNSHQLFFNYYYF